MSVLAGQRGAPTDPVNVLVRDGDGDSCMDGTNNAVRVNVVAGAAGGTAQADESAFTEGTTSFTPVGGVLNDTIASDPTEDQAAAFRITAKRGLHTNLRNVGGTEIGTATDPVRVDPTGTTAQPVTDNSGSLTVDAASWPLPTGAATAANQLPDGHNVTVDNAAGAAAVNVQDGGNSLTVDGTVTANAGTGPWPVTDNSGSLTVDGTVTANAGTGTFTVGGTVTANAGSGTYQVQGDVAHDGADAGNPVKVGGQARTTNPTAVADAARANAIFDKLGRQVVVLNHVRDLVTRNNITLSSTAETTLLAAGASGVFHDLTMLTMSNTSATKVRVDIRDATGGTVLLSMSLAADGGGAVMPFPVPLKQTTAANNWTAQLSAAVTDVRLMAQAVKNL